MTLSQRSAEQYNPSSQEQPDPRLLRIRYITLCSRNGLKNGCLQRKNVRYGKHCVRGYCSSGSTQRSPVHAPKLTLTPAAPWQWEVLGWHSLKPGGSPQCSGTSPGANQPRHRRLRLPVQKLLPAVEQGWLLEGWGFPHAASQHGADRRGERVGGHPAGCKWRRPSVTQKNKVSLHHAANAQQR